MDMRITFLLFMFLHASYAWAGETHRAYLRAENDSALDVDWFFLNHHADGLWEFYYNDSMTLAVRGHYVNHLAEGSWQVFAFDGRVIEEMQFHRGRISGSCRYTYRRIHTEGTVFTPAGEGTDTAVFLPFRYVHRLRDSLGISELFMTPTKTGEYRSFLDDVLRTKEMHDSTGTLLRTLYFHQNGRFYMEELRESVPDTTIGKVMTIMNPAGQIVVLNGNGTDTTYYENHIYTITTYRNGWQETETVYAKDGSVTEVWYYEKENRVRRRKVLQQPREH